jgi:hypothetical protein
MSQSAVPPRARRTRTRHAGLMQRVQWFLSLVAVAAALSFATSWVLSGGHGKDAENARIERRIAQERAKNAVTTEAIKGIEGATGDGQAEARAGLVKKGLDRFTLVIDHPVPPAPDASVAGEEAGMLQPPTGVREYLPRLGILAVVLGLLFMVFRLLQRRSAVPVEAEDRSPRGRRRRRVYISSPGRQG